MSKEPTGLGIDATGGPVIDPTANVISLVQANKESADALRDMHDRCITAEIGQVRETVKWLEKVSEIHQTHDREIHRMEQEKLAAFRASDEAARLTEADRTLAAVQLVARSAETTAQDIRNVLTNTATTLAERDAARDREYNNRIAALEKANYEGAGKQAVVDPMMERLVDKIEMLVTSRDTGVGVREAKVEQRDNSKYVMAIIATVLAILAFIAGRGL